MTGATPRRGDRRDGRRRSRWEMLALLRPVSDALACSVAFGVGYATYVFAIDAGWIARTPPAPGPYAAIAVVFSTIALLVFAQQGLYRGRATVLNLWELETAVKSVMLSAALLFALLFFLDLEAYSRYVVVGAIGLTMLLVVLERRAMSALARKLQLRGAAGRRVLIYGCQKTGQLLMKKIVESPQLGATVFGFLDDHVPIGSHVCCRITQTDPRLFEAPVLGRLENLEALVERHGVDELLVADSSLSAERQSDVVGLCDRLGLEVGVVPGLGDIRSDQLRVEDISAIPVLRPVHPADRKLGAAAKRAFDLVAAIVLLVFAAPVFALVAAAIRIEGGGDVFFSQHRVGRDGRTFRIFKFRTMRHDAPAYASSPADDGDPSITRLGRILRKTGLDELPQLVNVIRGEMSLVGPRPEMPHLVLRYSALERQRLRVRPGITGLWQLSADRHAEIHENIEYDLHYVHNQSLLLDLLVLFETVFFTLGVMIGCFDRRSVQRNGSAARGPAPMPAVDEGYVLVALDQRTDQALPASWRTCLPASYAISDRWSVRVVVAEGNRRALGDLLEETAGRLGGDGRRTSFAQYESRSELRRQVLGARLVVTDLPHVAEWTDEAGLDLLFAEPGGVKWWPRSRAPDPIVAELSRRITVQVASSDGTSRQGARVPSIISLTG